MRIAFAFLAVLLAAAFWYVPAARAQMITALTATLTPVTSAPTGATDAANASRAGGTATFTIDRTARLLRWQVTYAGLSSDAVEVHIHAGAGPGVSPSILVDLGTSGVGNPIIGSTTLEDTQLADLLAGRTFVDIHTKLNDSGEISGHISP